MVDGEKRFTRYERRDTLHAIRMTNFMKQKFLISFIASLLMLAACNKLPTDPDHRDIVEVERVWQYCKAFSLYTDRVPARERVLEFDSIQHLVDSIYDTLHIHWANKKYFVAEYYYLSRRMGADYSLESGNTVWADSVYAITDSTAYLHIDDFMDPNLYSTIINKYNSIMKNHPNLIIDLRANSGGYIDVSIQFIESFLAKGTSYLSVSYRKTKINSAQDTGLVKNEIWQCTEDDNVWEGKKIVIFIDNNSASAAELLTVALRDGLGAKAYIIGNKSFGKAIGQNVFTLLNNAHLVITGYRFFPVNDSDYHEKGITPDLVFTGSLQQEINEALKWLESGYSTKIDQAALSRIVAKYTSKKSSFRHPACYRIIKTKNLPLF